MTILRRMTQVTLIALCLCSVIPALADDAEPETTGEVSVGGQGLSDDPHDAAKFYEYRDVPGGFVAERFNLNWTPRPGWFFNMDAYDISEKDARGAVTFGKVDVWKGTIRWLDNPRRWGDGTRMLYAETGDNYFSLPDALQSAIQAAPATADTTPVDGVWDAGTKGALIKNAIDQGAQDVFLGYQRRTAGLAFTYTPTRSWTFDVDASRERRSGTNPQPLGFYFTFAPSEVAAPIEFKTDWATARGEYHHKRWNAGVQITSSEFTTGTKSLTWDNQLNLTDQALSGVTSAPGMGRLTFQTDNDMTQAVVYGGVNLPGRTRIDVTSAVTEITQDDPFLPMTINSVINPLLAVLPAASLDGKHSYNLTSLRASGRPLSWLRWSAWGREYELENDSPMLLFQEYVQTDYAIPLCSNANACGATTNRIQRESLSYSYKRTNAGVMGGVKPLSWLDASLSYEREEMKREFSAVEDSTENILKLTLDFDVLESLTIRATARSQERRADEYNAHYLEESFPIGEPYIAGFNEGARRHYWTDRDRDALSLLVDWTPTAKLSLFAEATYARDEYFDPETGERVGGTFDVMEDRNFDTTPEAYTLRIAGRTDDKNLSYTAGFTVNPTSRISVYGDYTWEAFTYGLETRYRNVSGNIGTDNPLDDWGSDTRDEYTTVNLGVNVDLNKDATWKLAVNGTRSEGTGEISTHFVPGGAASGDTTLTEFPRLKTTLTIATVDLTHRIRPNLDYRLRYWHEKWDESNWASDFMQPYMGDPGNDPGSSQAIYLGMDFDNYDYDILSLIFRYRF